MDDLRASLKAEAESLKRMVDTVTSHEIEQVNKIEDSLQQLLKSQDIKYNGYISYLHEVVKKFHGYLSSKDIKTLVREITTNLKIDPIPETTKPVPPVFTAGQYRKDDVIKLLGIVTVPDTKPENREIKPMETASTQLKLTGKMRKQDREKSDVKPTLSLSSVVTKVSDYKVPGVGSVCHISLGKSGILWASDDKGHLVQTDLQGILLQKIKTMGGNEGYHTITQDGDLIFTDRKNKVIYRIKQDKTITEFINTRDWEPISIHSSHINGDILVGMRKGREAKVTKYNKTGEEIQNIQRNKGKELYRNPNYITENINGDICTSDYGKQSVVVVNKSRRYRFSYTSQRSEFHPFSICTDLLGHILVDVVNRNTGLLPVADRYYVHLLDQDGQFLSVLLRQKLTISPCSLCVDEENNLHIGEYFNTTVTVFKYLQ